MEEAHKYLIKRKSTILFPKFPSSEPLELRKKPCEVLNSTASSKTEFNADLT